MQQLDRETTVYLGSLPCSQRFSPCCRSPFRYSRHHIWTPVMEWTAILVPPLLFSFPHTFYLALFQTEFVVRTCADYRRLSQACRYSMLEVLLWMQPMLQPMPHMLWRRLLVALFH